MGVPSQFRNCLLLSQRQDDEAAHPRRIDDGAPAASPHAYVPTSRTATISRPM
eukprot:CAMPEP_0174711768 /NCGR_PEP_ID=MMETSP1094-20130205/12991_1 /TAXON_ID=156173 /ORGANISM="Chrysochromulina brevifilum, Strain UTEX LB 985" /LENGTH=52 /DNA_ID=CAMNT_0015910753 /DNA_START=659 /DNA_END=817 /DNA_ORIENTATION=-